MNKKNKAYKSLKSTIIIWFFLVSVVPLSFFLGFTLVTFQESFKEEILKRLEGRKDEIQNFIYDLLQKNRQTRKKIEMNPAFIHELQFENKVSLRGYLDQLIRSDYSHQVSLFNAQGLLLLQTVKESPQKVTLFEPEGDISLAEDLMNQVKNKKELLLTEGTVKKEISLVLLSTLKNPEGKILGFLEQIIFLNNDLVSELKKRTKLEFLILTQEGDLIVSTQKDFFDYPDSNIKKLVNLKSDAFSEIKVQNQDYFLLIQPLVWGNTHFYMGLMISKSPVQETLKKINILFISFVLLLIFILFILIAMLSHYVVKPIKELLKMTQELAYNDQFAEIPVKSDHEIGLLTESFNKMSLVVVQSRKELKNKIQELENLNLELSQAQAQLVHNSKMASLGQLVAGVAHELNNPIGYIYSNMSLLNQYTSQFIKFSEQVSLNPQKITELKKQFDIDFISTDIPKLIRSCSEGAQRTKDIVQGLRNFSRLEEAQEKEFNLHESIDNSLSLLQSEIKDRIQIHKYYGGIPLYVGRPSEINQALMNILTNAVQAIEGPGNIWITTDLIKSDPNHPQISISIQDSGPGISDEIKDKIFDPFFSTKDVGKGTGLGLSITFGIIQKHKGQIQVKSKPGKGTEFIILLPINLPPST